MRAISAVIAVLIVLLGVNSAFVVKEGQSALLLQFGRIVATDYAPGLHFKLPFVQQAVRFDNRILTLDAQPERYFTAEKKSVNIDFYVKWRVADVAAYYRATAGEELQAGQRLTPIVKDALRFEVNALPLDELISGGRQDITERVRQLTDVATRKTLGITVTDVRIKRIDLPDEVSESVYNRMKAERLRIANGLRSTGKEEAAKIEADADRQKVVLLADAQKQAAQTRGEGDAKAAAIYAAAYGKDPGFFAFYRSLQSYRTALGSGKSVIVLDPGSDFMRQFSEEPKR
ncbi:MAG TPA: protease modulator HflC [Mizugakiibacter sp.]